MDKLTSQDFSSRVSESQTGSVVRAAAQAKRELCSRGRVLSRLGKERNENEWAKALGPPLFIALEQKRQWLLRATSL